MSAATARQPSYWFLAQPLTGRLWRVDVRSGRVFMFEGDENLCWQEIERELFKRQVKAHEIIDLNACREVLLCGS